MPVDPELVRGTLGTIVLKLLAERPMYGYEICKAVKTRSRELLDAKEGSLYPALARMEVGGLVRPFWETPESGRRRKYYRITPKGQKQLARASRDWFEFTGAVGRILGEQPDASPIA